MQVLLWRRKSIVAWETLSFGDMGLRVAYEVSRMRSSHSTGCLEEKPLLLFVRDFDFDFSGRSGSSWSVWDEVFTVCVVIVVAVGGLNARVRENPRSTTLALLLFVVPPWQDASEDPLSRSGNRVAAVGDTWPSDTLPSTAVIFGTLIDPRFNHMVSAWASKFKQCSAAEQEDKKPLFVSSICMMHDRGA